MFRFGALLEAEADVKDGTKKEETGRYPDKDSLLETVGEVGTGGCGAVPKFVIVLQ